MKYAWLQFLRGTVAQTLLDWALAAAPEHEKDIYADARRVIATRLYASSPILQEGVRQWEASQKD